MLAWLWRDQWIYLVAPSLAGATVALGYRWIVGSHRIVTAKLFHPVTQQVRCHFRQCAFCAMTPAVTPAALGGQGQLSAEMEN